MAARKDFPGLAVDDDGTDGNLATPGTAPRIGQGHGHGIFFVAYLPCHGGRLASARVARKGFAA
jgi:hypothetical protein